MDGGRSERAASVTRLSAIGRRTFSAMTIPNFRRFFYGQSTSLIGTWMQSVAQSWVVFTLTHSAAAIGFVLALQTLPVLLLAPYGGVIADRVDKRRFLALLQGLMGAQALVLGVLIVTNAVVFWEICFLAVVLGLNNCFETPTRQAFMLELVGPDQVRNAVSLNSTMVNAARAIGPASAGLLIATVGVGLCFLINALSFGAVVYSLTSMDPRALAPTPRAPRSKGQLREGLRYVRGEPRLWVPLVMASLVGMMAWEFPVTLPVLAKQIFGGDAATYGYLTAATGLGAVFGGLFTATRGRVGLPTMTYAGTGFGVAMLCAALAPSFAFAFVALTATGFAAICFMSTGNATLQLAAEPSMRGRVMALWAAGFMGSTPIGGPLVGWIIQSAGARSGLAAGGLACLIAATIGVVAMRRGVGAASASSARSISGEQEAVSRAMPLVAADTD
jgi:MFS family permease